MPGLVHLHFGSSVRAQHSLSSKGETQTQLSAAQVAAELGVAPELVRLITSGNEFRSDSQLLREAHLHRPYQLQARFCCAWNSRSESAKTLSLTAYAAAITALQRCAMAVPLAADTAFLQAQRCRATCGRLNLRIGMEFG